MSDAHLVALMAWLDDAPTEVAVARALWYLTEAKRQVREAERAAARAPVDDTPDPDCPTCEVGEPRHLATCPWRHDYR